MRILDRSVYVGPSVYALFPVIRLEVDLGKLEEWPSSRLGTPFIEGLLALLPGLREHGCSYGEAGGFVRRLTEDEGTWMGHILEHVAIELQALAGQHVSFGKTRGADLPGLYHVVFEYEQQTVGLEAAAFAMRLLRSLLPPELAADMVVETPDEPFNLRRGARQLHPLRPAAQPRAQHHVPGARRRGARHPMDQAQRPEPDPVRARPVPAAHPGHGHRPHLQHRGRARLR